MNNTLDASLETNFNIAVKMNEKKHDYSSLIKFIQADKLVEKQIAILKLTEIKSKKDAMIVVSNLVGQDGKIREATAFKINELTINPEFSLFFIDEKIFEVLFEGIMDINGNVCRYIIELVVRIKTFDEYICKKLPKRINIVLDEIKKIEQETRQYVISKRNFQLYWCLEVLFQIIHEIDIDEIKDIIFRTSEFQDYTIREKTAKILAKIDCIEFVGLKRRLCDDENYYVKKHLRQAERV